MGKKYSYYLGNAEIKSQFHEVASGEIKTFKKTGFWNKKTSLISSFPLNRGSNLETKYINDNGSGSFKVHTNNRELDYWIWDDARGFADEVQREIDNAPS